MKPIDFFDIFLNILWHDFIDVSDAGHWTPMEDIGGYGYFGELYIGSQIVNISGG